MANSIRVDKFIRSEIDRDSVCLTRGWTGINEKCSSLTGFLDNNSNQTNKVTVHFNSRCQFGAQIIKIDMKRV